MNFVDHSLVLTLTVAYGVFFYLLLRILSKAAR